MLATIYGVISKMKLLADAHMAPTWRKKSLCGLHLYEPLNHWLTFGPLNLGPNGVIN